MERKVRNNSSFLFLSASNATKSIVVLDEKPSPKQRLVGPGTSSQAPATDQLAACEFEVDEKLLEKMKGSSFFHWN